MKKKKHITDSIRVSHEIDFDILQEALGTMMANNEIASSGDTIFWEYVEIESLEQVRQQLREWLLRFGRHWNNDEEGSKALQDNEYGSTWRNYIGLAELEEKFSELYNDWMERYNADDKQILDIESAISKIPDTDTSGIIDKVYKFLGYEAEDTWEIVQRQEPDLEEIWRTQQLKNVLSSDVSRMSKNERNKLLKFLQEIAL